MPVRPSDLRAIPLFAHITDEHLEQLLTEFQRRSLNPGDILFEAGSTADRLILLCQGEVAVREGSEERFRLRPVAPIGELGALTGLRRTTTAIAATACEVLSLSVEGLMRFFEAHGDVAYPFHHNLLHIVTDKLLRDRRRLDEMRRNIIHTQKAMKRMREALLDADDTPLSRMLFEELDALIEQNKKGHYLVDPAKAFPTRVRLDDGTMRNVLRMSNEWLHVATGDATPPAKGAEWSGVLVTPDGEVPLSGTVEDGDATQFVICLDMLIDEYARAVETHLTRLQMLDVIL